MYNTYTRNSRSTVHIPVRQYGIAGGGVSRYKIIMYKHKRAPWCLRRDRKCATAENTTTVLRKAMSVHA